MPLTAEDIHEAFLQTRQENYQDSEFWGVPWDKLNDKEKLCYDRMAELLNSKAGQPVNARLIAEAPVMLELIKRGLLVDAQDAPDIAGQSSCPCWLCKEGRAIVQRVEAK